MKMNLLNLKKIPALLAVLLGLTLTSRNHGNNTVKELLITNHELE